MNYDSINICLRGFSSGINPDELVECYSDRNCLSETTPLLMTRRECCVDTQSAAGFKLEGSGVCNVCVGEYLL